MRSTIDGQQKGRRGGNLREDNVRGEGITRLKTRHFDELLSKKETNRFFERRLAERMGDG